jgi:beta-glucosidase
LLTDILQQQWGFRGFVQSDWMFGMRDAKKAALAGQHIEMPLKNVFHRFLRDLVKTGEVPEAVVDDAALRILRQQMRSRRGATRATTRPRSSAVRITADLREKPPRRASCS